MKPESGEAVVELLRRLTGTDPVLTHDRRTGLATACAYVTQARWWSKGRRQVKDGLAMIRDCGLDVGPGKVGWRKVAKADWSESWKRHFKPMLLGRHLLVRPSWSPRRPKGRQVEIVLDPGLSFGTGQHPTTGFCLETMVRLRPAEGESRALLDVGTGSGILALAAARVGYDRVEAFDFDPEAVVVARRNARDNGLSRQVKPRVGDVAALRVPAERFDVVCANLTADLLARHARKLRGQVRPGGHLVLAGILAEEFDAVVEVFTKLGFRLADSVSRDEWRSGAFLLSP